MDIFGAFQFCSIAILAAPLTVRLSRTYFYDPGQFHPSVDGAFGSCFDFGTGRNIIFLWTVLILMGLIALCVEFYRATPSDCTDKTTGIPNFRPKDFIYGPQTCGLICSESQGPFSPIRGGAASEIFVVPVPKRLTFNAAMLLAAGFCIPVCDRRYSSLAPLMSRQNFPHGIC
jgi:hypothetical protein